MGKELRVSLAVIGVVLVVFCSLLFLRLRQHDLQPPTMNVGNDLRATGSRSLPPPTPPQPRIVRQPDWTAIGSPLDNPVERPERAHADRPAGTPTIPEAPHDVPGARASDPQSILAEPLVNPRP